MQMNLDVIDEDVIDETLILLKLILLMMMLMMLWLIIYFLIYHEQFDVPLPNILEHSILSLNKFYIVRLF